jgi:hypothetical protein
MPHSKRVWLADIGKTLFSGGSNKVTQRRAVCRQPGASGGNWTPYWKIMKRISLLTIPSLQKEMKMSEDSITLCRTTGKKPLYCSSSTQPGEDKSSTVGGHGFFGQITGVSQPFWLSPSLQMIKSISQVYHGHLWWTVVLRLTLMRSMWLICDIFITSIHL